MTKVSGFEASASEDDPLTGSYNSSATVPADNPSPSDMRNDARKQNIAWLNDLFGRPDGGAACNLWFAGVERGNAIEIEGFFRMLGGINGSESRSDEFAEFYPASSDHRSIPANARIPP
jgi:hypothetical protein